MNTGAGKGSFRCPEDAENDWDTDLQCGNVDDCPYDFENDIDVDDTCGNFDSCPFDAANDFDSDNICGDVDSCAQDPLNDVDSDKICTPDDVCQYDPEHDADSDENLMLRYAAGEARAFDALYGRYRLRLLRYLVRLTGQTAVAEDNRLRWNNLGPILQTFSCHRYLPT